MRLERLELENVCQHQHLEHVWHPGLNGILGPNGSGKSNIVKAIRFAITGQFDNAGTKAENICQLAGDKARSRVVLSFEHEGIRAEITRVLRRGTSSCRINGSEQVDGDNAVTTAVMDLLGVDQRILSEYIFVPQRRMAGFVDETPGERNKTFGQLFDLARAEAVYKLLDAEAKRINPPPPSAEIGLWRERIARQRSRRDELRNTLDAGRGELRKLEPNLARKLIARAECWENDKKVLDTFTTQVDQLAVDLAARQAELQAAIAERSGLVQAYEGATDDLEAARTTLAYWEAAKHRRERQAALQARQDALSLEQENRQEPQPPHDFPGDEALKSRLAELNHAVRIREELLVNFQDKPRICPTCGADTDAILEKAAIYEEELPELTQLLRTARKLEEAYLSYKYDHDQWKYWSKSHAKRRVELACEWAALQEGEDEVATADPKTCRALIDAGAGLEKAIVEVNARAEQLRKDVNRISAKLDDASRKHVKQHEALGVRPDPNAVVAAREDLKRAEQLERDIRYGEGELDVIGVDLLDNEGLLSRLEAIEAKADLDRLWVYHLNEVRKIMHHDKLPKVVAHNYLEILADDTNELLESFDADFRVGLGEGLSFTATFLRGLYAGAVSPAQRLSEGQKVLLALAFRVAVNSLFAGTAGLLCLDEPTESLDERNLACLEVAIGKMRDLSESRGMQCLLVTHEPSFEVLFDGVLRLVA